MDSALGAQNPTIVCGVRPSAGMKFRQGAGIVAQYHGDILVDAGFADDRIAKYPVGHAQQVNR